MLQFSFLKQYKISLCNPQRHKKTTRNCSVKVHCDCRSNITWVVPILNNLFLNSSMKRKWNRSHKKRKNCSWRCWCPRTRLSQDEADNKVSVCAPRATEGTLCVQWHQWRDTEDGETSDNRRVTHVSSTTHLSMNEEAQIKRGNSYAVTHGGAQDAAEFKWARRMKKILFFLQVVLYLSHFSTLQRLHVWSPQLLILEICDCCLSCMDQCCWVIQQFLDTFICTFMC